MDWQQLAVALALTASAAYIARSAWQAWTGSAAGCGSGCGKCAAPTAPTPEAGRRIQLL